MMHLIRNMVKNYFQRRLASYFLLFAFLLSLTGGRLSSSARPGAIAHITAELYSPIRRSFIRHWLISTNTWTVMCVAAHPDDEDGTTLTVLRRRDGAHTVKSVFKPTVRADRTRLALSSMNNWE